MNFNGQTLILLNSIETLWHYFACKSIQLDNLDLVLLVRGLHGPGSRQAWPGLEIY